nr:hypothetical protein CFP56_76962 [Quercus suber]
MSYNDEYMVWFRPHTVRHITKETSYWDTLVESQLRIIAKCEPGFEIYTNCINALQSVEELGRLTLDDARAAGNTREPAVRRGRQAGRRQGQGGRQSSQRPTSGQCPGVTHPCPHLVGVTHPCMTTPWRRQGETSQGTSEEKKTGMIFDGQLGEIFIENALLGKYLDENRDLILEIMENQNVEKFAECA